MKISSCSELKGQLVKELASQNDLWTSCWGFNQQAVICVLSWWLKWNCCGAVNEICVWSPLWWIKLNVLSCVTPYGVLCMRISLFTSYQDLFIWNPFLYQNFFYFWDSFLFIIITVIFKHKIQVQLIPVNIFISSTFHFCSWNFSCKKINVVLHHVGQFHIRQFHRL